MRQNCSQSIHSHLSGPDKSSNEHPTPVAMSFDGNGCWCECDMMNRIGFHAQRLMTTTKSITYFPAQIFHGCVCEVAVDLYSLSLHSLEHSHHRHNTKPKKKEEEHQSRAVCIGSKQTAPQCNTTCSNHRRMRYRNDGDGKPPFNNGNDGCGCRCLARMPAVAPTTIAYIEFYYGGHISHANNGT